jgi:hypothetical protein
LQTLAQQKGYAEPSVSSAAADETVDGGKSALLTFTTSTNVTLDAASNRYQQIIAAGE